ncbi:MAG: hypothetical protein M3Q68_07360, partial [Actinomycetota bacterium]|nr:hypothetical protein [Actinomycetota bacterium]
MRRPILAVLAVLAALTSVLATSSAPAGAAGVVDLSASAASSPLAVSPPGALVFYTATFANEGAVAVDAILTNTTSNGSVVSFTGDSTCARSGAEITCIDSLAPGETKVVSVVVQSPLTAPSTIANVSRARVNPGLVQVVDLATANNDATITTPVRASTGVGAAGFAREGDTIPFRKHVLTVLEADLGVVAFLNDVPDVQTANCGGQPCQEGLRADYDQDPRFAGKVSIDVNFGSSEPCRGIGNDRCHPLFYRVSPTSPTFPVLRCGEEGAAKVCGTGVRKIGNQFHI